MQMLNDFFFLRPLWLLALIPVAMIVVLAWRLRGQTADRAWHGLVDSHLLSALVTRDTGATRSRWLPALLGLGLSIAVIAMAGPTWEKVELPAFKSKEPTVVALSLAQSMNASDVAPSRLRRAGHKLRDILEMTRGGDTGLVIYADRPFVAAPLTGDGAVIGEMLPELSTSLMPVLGNRPDLALQRSAQLLADAGATKGRIILLADNAGQNPAATDRAARAARQAGYTVDVLGIGADGTAALQTATGQTIADASGKAMTATFDPEALRQVAENGGGTYSALTAGEQDLAPFFKGDTAGGTKLPDEIKADRWADMGYWLLLIPALLAPLAFRRNLVLSVALIASGLFASGQGAQAGTLDTAFMTPDQRAAKAFDNQDFATASKTFEQPEWRASALYRQGKYEAAAAAFAGTGAERDTYNRANATAKAGDLQGALDLYDRYLKDHPGDADAIFNRDLVRRLLDEQKKREEQKKQDQQQTGQQGQPDQQQAGQQGQPDQQQAGQQGQQDQQQAGQQGQQDQQQAGQQGQPDQPQPGQQGQQDQQQAGQQGQQDQQQAGQQGQPDQQQAGQQGQPDQQQAGQQGQPDQQQAGQQGQQDQQQAGQQGQQDRQQAGQQGQPDQQQAGQQGQPDEQTRSAFRDAMDRILGGNGSVEPSPPSEPQPEQVAGGYSEKDQANEQLLRTVPDDASGLLRARIRQYYSQTR